MRSTLTALALLLGLAFSHRTAMAYQAEVEDLIAQARSASAHDEHEAAIAAYRRAIELEPVSRDSLSLGLATQLTWAGRNDEAIGEFRWLLLRQPQRIEAWKVLALAQAWSGHSEDALESYRRVLDYDPNDADARFGEARMLAWSGKSTRAVHAYESLLRDHPDHRDAKLGLAMLHNWRGDHEKSASFFAPLTLTDPKLHDGWEGLAWAQHWGGRDDLALQSLERQEEAGAASPAASDLRELVLNEWRRRVDFSFDYAEDSDDFTTESAKLVFEFPVAYRGHLRVGALSNRFTLPDSDDVRDSWVLASGDVRLHRRWVASATMQAAIERPRGADYFPLQEDLNIGWLASDRVRLDLGYSHFALFSYKTTPQRILGDLVGGGVTYRPEHRTTVIVSGDYASYSDRNDRRNLRGRVRYSVFPRRPRLLAEIGAQSLNFRHDLPNGIWTPDDYRAGYGRLEMEINPDRVVTFVATGDGGWAKEAPGDFTPYFAYSGAVIWRGRPVRVEARAGHSDGNVETGRGYRRTYAALELTAAF